MTTGSKSVLALAFGLAFMGCESLIPRPVKTAPSPPPKPDSAVDLTQTAPSAKAVRFHARAYDGIRLHTFSTVGQDLDPDVSPDGKLLVFASNHHSPTYDIYIKTVDGRTLTQLTSDPADDMQPAFSPNGQWIAYASNRNGNWDIFVLDLARRKSVQLTDSRQHDVHPAWSPDGRQIVYSSCSARTGQWELWLTSLETPGKQQILGPGLYPRWHPTGNQVAFQRPREREGRWFSIWTIHLVHAEAKYPTEIVSDAQWAAVSPTWSPDGRRLAFAAVDKGQGASPDPAVQRPSDIYAVGIDGNDLVRLTEGPSANWSPCWAADGRIYFVSDRNQHVNIWSLKPTATALAP